MIRNALIAGATGLVGKELVQFLLKTDYYNSLHIVGRRPYELEHLKIKSYKVDFNHFEEFKCSALIHDVYICLGTTMKKAGSRENFSKVDFGYILKIGQWARKNSVGKLAVISSMGSSESSKNFYLRTKGEMEKAIANLILPNVIVMRPSLLLGQREEFRLAEKMGIIFSRPLIKLMIGRLRKYRPVYASQVAKAMFHLTINAERMVTIVENEEIIDLPI